MSSENPISFLQAISRCAFKRILVMKELMWTALQSPFVTYRIYRHGEVSDVHLLDCLVGCGMVAWNHKRHEIMKSSGMGHEAFSSVPNQLRLRPSAELISSPNYRLLPEVSNIIIVKPADSAFNISSVRSTRNDQTWVLKSDKNPVW